MDTEIFSCAASGRRLLTAGFTCLLLTLPFPLRADIPAPFSAEYEARYGGLRAEAQRSLQETGEGEYEMRTFLQLQLLGRTVSSIEERSLLATNEEGLIRPLVYSFVQKGLGKRSREISFDWDNATAIATSGNRDDYYEIPLEANITDNLSAYLEVRRQMLTGAQEIVFPGIDKTELHEFRYRVTGEETLETHLGTMQTLKLERVRDPGKDRSTEMWLAPDWDYLLVKLVQKEPGASTISLDLTRASIGDREVSASRAAGN